MLDISKEGKENKKLTTYKILLVRCVTEQEKEREKKKKAKKEKDKKE